MFHHEEAWNYLQDIEPDFHFQDEKYQTIFLLYESFHDDLKEVGQIDRFLDRIHNTELIKDIIEIEMLNLQSDVSEQEIIDLVHIISSKASLEVLLQQKMKEMREANRNQQNEEAKRLLMDIVTLSQKIKVTKK
ncbi:hypothetical protein LZ578_07230 [Jeotgalibaca sp. MA1X17-3]|uniref:hypothetical protein n=1 Tax=Jeotgalibaca sp. MA1X17-3 TaxID=2908211 RepID=UPI001F33F7F8|nr:hypothetical protein [Jeotgalibaca sp. MA1X17-3]UJF14811.1 hypothetical protein LZ578_07230 [Jeotgalibaca sp. MA1X17-3]